MRGSSLSRIVAVCVLAFVSTFAGVVGLSPASTGKQSPAHAACQQAPDADNAKGTASRRPCNTEPTGSGVLRSSIETSPRGRLFSPTSVWNRVVPQRARLAPDSRGITGYLNSFVNSSQTEGVGPWINTTDYSTPIYTVPAHQRTVRVQFTYPTPGLDQAFDAVPIPPGAQPAAGTDAQMTIYQPSTNTLWELWELHRMPSGQWQAGVGRPHPAGVVESRLLPERGRSERKHARAEQLGRHRVGSTDRRRADHAVGSGLGHINHALALLVPKAKAKVFYCPAQRTDGYDTSADAIPEGAHFRLDPGLDLSKLAMPPVTRMIAEAAQKYGLIVNDRTGVTVGFRAQDPTPLMRTGLPNPYGTYFANPASGHYQMPTQFLASFPWSHLQLLAPPPHC